MREFCLKLGKSARSRAQPLIVDFQAADSAIEARAIRCLAAQGTQT